MSIGERIRTRRKELKLTQPQLGKLCGGISKSSVSQWENDGTKPTGSHIVHLAHALKTTERWLDRGLGPKQPKSDVNPSAAIPVINFVQAGGWAEATEPYPPGTADRYLLPSRHVGPRAFALTIVGRSMEPDFHEGDEIIVDPDIPARNGDFVVAKRSQDDEATFKKFNRREGAVELRPLNKGYETLRLDRDNPGRIVGVVVEHRRYLR